MAVQTAESGIPVWTVADRLVKARSVAGLTQIQMADELQIHRRSITRYESLPHPPRSIILAYAAVTGVPVWWIEGGDNSPNPPDIRDYPAVASFTRLALVA